MVFKNQIRSKSKIKYVTFTSYNSFSSTVTIKLAHVGNVLKINIRIYCP